MAVGREAFGRCWGAGGAAMEGLVPFIVQRPLELCGLSHPAEHDEQLRTGPGPRPGSRLLAQGCPAFRAMGNTFLLLIRHTHVRIVVFC